MVLGKLPIDVTKAGKKIDGYTGKQKKERKERKGRKTERYEVVLYRLATAS